MKKLMVMAAVLVLAAGSAFAADWNFYGSARVSTFYSSIDNNPFKGGSDSDSYEHSLNGNARIGARVKVSDELSGRFEYGALDGNVNVRILWGEWNFGKGSLGVGQHYTPLLFPYSNQVYNIDAFNLGDTNMSRFGMVYGGREPQIRLKFGGFQIAAVEYEFNESLIDTSSLVGLTSYTEMDWPGIQAKYKYDGDNWHIQACGGISTFDFTVGGVTHDVDSYIYGLGGRVNFGGAYFKGNIWAGQNVGNQVEIMVNGDIPPSLGGTGFGTGFGFAQYDATTGRLVDNEAWGFLLVAGYAIRKGLYIEAGYGQVNTELDEPTFLTNAFPTLYEEDEVESYYIQMTIFLAEGVFLTPEVGRVDFKEEGQPDAHYAGLKWQINF